MRGGNLSHPSIGQIVLQQVDGVPYDTLVGFRDTTAEGMNLEAAGNQSWQAGSSDKPTSPGDENPTHNSIDPILDQAT
jgi:hypothetical protein